MADAEPALMELVRAIAAGNARAWARMLKASPALASASVEVGATRREAATYYLDEINHYVYVGDTALHIAAAAYGPDLVRSCSSSALTSAPRIAEVLSRCTTPSTAFPARTLGVRRHKLPSSPRSSPPAPIRMRRTRVESHRCTGRCALAAVPAVRSLLDGGADATRRNKSGSTPMKLATQTTGRGGSGSPDAKAQQALIVQLLQGHGAAP